MNKYLKLGRLFTDADGKQEDYYIDGFIEYLRRLSDELNLPLLSNMVLRRRTLNKSAELQS